MSIPTVYRTDTLDGWRVKTNSIAASIGDVSTISSNIVNRSDVVVAVNDLMSYIGTPVLATVAQTLRGAINEIKDSNLTFGGSKTFSGAVAASGTLAVTGASTFSSGSFSSTLGVAGDLSVNTNKFVVAGASGNTAIAGTLNVTGTSTLGSLGATTGSFSSTLSSIGNLSVNTNKFVVAGASGNTAIAGTLGVTGASTFSSGSFSSTLSSIGDLSVNTNKFVVAGASGNTAIAGTLGVTGASTFSTISTSGLATLSSVSIGGAASIGTTLGVTGATTLSTFSASSGSVSGGLSVSGTSTSSGLSVHSTALNDGSLVYRLTNSNAAFSSSPNRVTFDTAGNVVINGNLSVAGTTSLSGGTTTSLDWSNITNKPSPVIQVTLTGPVTGSGSMTLSSLAAGTYTASFATTISNGSVVLGTHTTGNYAATVAAGTGVSVSGTGAGPYYGAVTITNSDRGSSQNIFKNIAVSGQSTVVAGANSDTLSFVSGTNITITTDSLTKSVTISAATASTPNDPTVTLTAGTGLSGGGTFTLNQSAPASVSFSNSDRGSSQNIFKNIASAGSTTLNAAANSDTLNLVAGQVSSTPGLAISLSAGQNVTISHFDTSSIANASNSAGTVVQSLTFDTYGHALTVGSINLDTRYLQSYTETSTLDAVTTRGSTTSNGITVGSLIVSGSGSASIGGNLTVSGNLTINGTTTTVSSTTLAVQDPIITLGGTAAPSSDDGKDRGVEYRYYSGGARVGFFGRRYATGRFGFIPNATNTSEVFTGSLGDIEAGTFYGSLSGNASSATVLQTARAINGVSFDGSAAITVTANTPNSLSAGAGLSGGPFNGSAAASLSLSASGVGTAGTVGSSSAIPVITYDTYGRITSITSAAPNNGTLTLSTSGVGISGSSSFTADQSGNSTFTITSNATSANTASAIVARDGSGNFSAGTITATLSGTATNISAFTINQNLGTGNSPSFSGLYSTAQANFQGSQGSNMGTSAGYLGGLMVQGNGTNAAFMTFHRPYSYAAYFGLDADNVWKVGGWSMGDAAYPILHSGNYTSYSPSLGGSGASGTWGISVTGSAGSVSWGNVSGRPTTLSAFSNDSGYITASYTGTFTVTGEIRATGNVVAYYSDDRLKTRVAPISDALSKVSTLNGFYFHGNERAAELGYDSQKIQVGVSAQEVERILPEIIHPAPIDSAYKTLDYSKLVPLLIEAIKELKTRVELLENK